MKLFPLLIAAVLPVFACAQEPAAGKTPAAEPAPLPEPPPPAPENTLPEKKGKPTQENPLVPDGLLPTKPNTNRPRQRSTQPAPTTSDDLDARIRFRKAYDKAANDPKIHAIWEESRHALTDFAKRDALRRYFDAVYKSINPKDKVLAQMVVDRRYLSLRRLEQSRIEHTEPLDNDNTDR